MYDSRDVRKWRLCESRGLPDPWVTRPAKTGKRSFPTRCSKLQNSCLFYVSEGLLLIRDSFLRFLLGTCRGKSHEPCVTGWLHERSTNNPSFESPPDPSKDNINNHIHLIRTCPDRVDHLNLSLDKDVSPDRRCKTRACGGLKVVGKARQTRRRLEGLK